ncbi:1-aminocyclopropane-1-carboxylate oxidase homolog 12-like isoform X1 [Pistacia vera]|uniref:1-aminocyclopropane-1-carboxylate oxidase homolog 12-like isoform X1 n=1 Tax=Pistacia vera TaxID=55513 RepID=UPI00126309C9|nr:1-aminocyclopropane-1-carboxylate oxidase homolog 12-like isoform X1 [Pistacia vera]
MEFMFQLKKTLYELLSEALGISSEYLESIECIKTASLGCNYYHVCPEPNLTLGVANHSDPSFLTILLQDNIGGLQILRYNHWVDAPHLQGSLLANVGDILQLISNDKFKSVMHRVVAGSVGNRVSASCFFLPVTSNRDKTFGPVKELLSEVNPPIYREISYSEYIAHFKSKGHDVTSTLNGFQL